MPRKWSTKSLGRKTSQSSRTNLVRKKAYARKPAKSRAKKPAYSFSMAVKEAALSPCAINFLKAQYNPWGEFNEPPCIPDLIAIPSNKQCYRAVGNFSVGANGVGFITVNPYLMIYGSENHASTNPNYAAPLQFTTVNYTPTDFQTRSGYDSSWTRTNQISYAYTNAPYIAQDATDTSMQHGDFDYRIVGCGLKVQYAGAPLSRKGHYLLYEDPTNSGQLVNGIATTTGVQTSAGLLADSSIKQISIDENAHCVVWHPRQMSDLDYVASWQTSVPNTATYASLMIGITGAENAVNLTYDVVCHVELVGRATTGKTRTDSNVNDLGKILGHMETTPSAGSPQSTTYNKIKQIAYENIKHLPQDWQPAIKTAAFVADAYMG